MDTDAYAVDSPLQHLAGRYPGLLQLAVRAGQFAGTQRLDRLAQEQALWEWSARVLQVQLSDATARACWRQAFLASYHAAYAAPSRAADPDGTP